MNKKYGRLEVISEPFIKKGHKSVLCKCDCGTQKEVRFSSLKYNLVKSCGCLLKDGSIIHKLSKHPLYPIWNSMKNRCYNKNNKDYKNYGERGIIIDKYFLNVINFINWSILNGWQHGLTLERKDNNGNYSPDNCEWVTRKAQARNRRSNHYINIFNENKLIKEWSEDIRCVVTYKCLHKRIRNGWNPEKALTIRSERGVL